MCVVFLDVHGKYVIMPVVESFTTLCHSFTFYFDGAPHTVLQARRETHIRSWARSGRGDFQAKSPKLQSEEIARVKHLVLAATCHRSHDLDVCVDELS